uniref:Uncharacterized protein n=1 Tax=Arundo donax TaxID=35708 RepID=A0A0A9FYI9_ARUDO
MSQGTTANIFFLNWAKSQLQQVYDGAY